MANSPLTPQQRATLIALQQQDKASQRPRGGSTSTRQQRPRGGSTRQQPCEWDSLGDKIIRGILFIIIVFILVGLVTGYVSQHPDCNRSTRCDSTQTRH